MFTKFALSLLTLTFFKQLITLINLDELSKHELSALHKIAGISTKEFVTNNQNRLIFPACLDELLTRYYVILQL